MKLINTTVIWVDEQRQIVVYDGVIKQKTFVTEITSPYSSNSSASFVFVECNGIILDWTEYQQLIELGPSFGVVWKTL